MGEFVIVDKHEGWAEVVLNRPERRNAIIQPLAAELRDALRDLSADGSLRAVLLRGAGNAFCSGLDLTEMNADPPPDWLPRQGRTWRDVHIALFEFPGVVVGALERYAINAGAALALGCDLLVCGDESYLQVGEVQQGVAAPMNLAWLRARFSESIASRIAFTGRRLLGPELVALGIATESVPEGQVVARAQVLAGELGGHPAAGVLNTKAILRAMSPVDDAAAWFELAFTSSPHKQAGGGLRRVRPT